MRSVHALGLLLLVAVTGNGIALGQSFRVQCPTNTITHPDGTATQLVNSSEPAFNGPIALTCSVAGGCTASNNVGYSVPATTANGAIKCQQVSGGDGYSTMANGTQTFMFSFGPLSGLADIANGQPGTEFPNTFNVPYNQSTKPANGGLLLPGDPATTDGAAAGLQPSWPSANPTGTFTWNGAVGLEPEVVNNITIFDIAESTAGAGTTVIVQLNSPMSLSVGQTIVVSGTGGTPAKGGYDGTWTVSATNYTFPANQPANATLNGVTNYGFPAMDNFTFVATRSGLADVNESQTATVSTPPVIDGHVDPRQIMDVGVMNGTIPAPLVAFDEDDEMFLTLTNVGMIMRPDLFEQHTIHFHGYPNASSVYDGVPDASVAINIGGSFTYYYLSPDAGTYFWHCHITPPEHLQMGMVGQLYVRPRQNRLPSGTSLYAALEQENNVNGAISGGTVVSEALRIACNPAQDILCSAVTPAVNTGATQGLDKLGNPQKYVYNDGDGSTEYDVEYPLQIHGFDPNFHFVGMTFNPESFADMKSKFFLLNGRSYPDTTTPGPMYTESSDGRVHYSQPLPAIINIPAGGKALLRIADLAVDEYATLASLGIPMKEVGFNAKLLRDQAGNNMEFYTNSITLGGGESLDVILDASDAGCMASGMQAGCSTTLYPAGSTFYLYTPQLDHLSNDQENFGGLMTVVHICSSIVGAAPANSGMTTNDTYGNTCN